MRILLIQSYLGRKEKSVFPLGLAYLARNLDEHDVAAIDPNVLDDPFGSLRKKLHDFRPEIIGISLRNIDTTVFKDRFFYYKMLSTTINLVKEMLPDSKVIIGGSAFSLFAEEIMRRNQQIDFGVYLEGEETFRELLKNLSIPPKVGGVYYRDGETVSFTGLQHHFDFKNASLPRWDLFDLSLYNHPEGIGIQSKRGCALKCAYCTYPFLTGKGLRLRPPEKVVDEVEDIVGKYNIKYFMFADTVFNLPQRHAEEICRELIRRRIAAKWSAYFSLKEMNEEFIRLAREAGCYFFFFSPDGFSDRSLTMLRKEISKRDLTHVYNLVRRLNLKDTKFDFGFFLNAPGLNYFSFFSLQWLLLKTNFLLPRRKFMHVSVNVTRIEPHTELEKIALREKSLSKETDLLPHDEQFLSSVYYHNQDIKLAENIFKSLLFMKNLLIKLLAYF